ISERHRHFRGSALAGDYVERSAIPLYDLTQATDQRGSRRPVEPKRLRGPPDEDSRQWARCGSEIVPCALGFATNRLGVRTDGRERHRDDGRMSRNAILARSYNCNERVETPARRTTEDYDPRPTAALLPHPEC